MNKKMSKNVGKGVTAFFVTMAVLFAVLAGVKAMQIAGGSTAPTTKAEKTTANSSAGETSAVTHAPIISTTAAPKKPGPDEKIVYLTFDDGPTENTTKLMDVLEQNDVRGTFFVIHTYDGCEKQIREIYKRGHCVALHTYTHEYSIYKSEETYFDDLNKISDLVYQATGKRSMLIRFPGGSSNTISRKYKTGIMTTLTQEVTKRGYAYFDWNVDSTDASRKTVSVEKIVRNSTSGIGNTNQVVLLMHDAQAKTTTVQALPDVIKAYKDAGYRFDVLSTNAAECHHGVNN